jgi:hypothetical protein
MDSFALLRGADLSKPGARGRQEEAVFDSGNRGSRWGSSSLRKDHDHHGRPHGYRHPNPESHDHADEDNPADDDDHEHDDDHHDDDYASDRRRRRRRRLSRVSRVAYLPYLRIEYGPRLPFLPRVALLPLLLGMSPSDRT